MTFRLLWKLSVRGFFLSAGHCFARFGVSLVISPILIMTRNGMRVDECFMYSENRFYSVVYMYKVFIELKEKVERK